MAAARTFPGVLRIPRAVLDEILAHARAERPREACGILAGTTEADAHVVARAIPVRNAHPDPARAFTLDPAEQLRATIAIEDELALEVVGFYHSHPEGPARFSAVDAASASWPGASYLLVHLAPREGALSARWDGTAGGLAPEPIEVTPSGVSGAPRRRA